MGKIVYHRTQFANMKKILANGFKENKNIDRCECGVGVYCSETLDDSCNHYNKSHYGNSIIVLEIIGDIKYFKTKLDAMAFEKEHPFNKINIGYYNVTNGNVVVAKNFKILGGYKCTRVNQLPQQ